jgi:hypothetical protein
MNRINSVSVATIFTIILTTIVTIYAEFSEGFKTFLKSLIGHHWITKSVLSIVVFFAFYLFIKKSDKKIDILGEVWKVILVTLLCSLVLFFFFAWHYLKGQ